MYIPVGAGASVREARQYVMLRCSEISREKPLSEFLTMCVRVLQKQLASVSTKKQGIERAALLYLCLRRH